MEQEELIEKVQNLQDQVNNLSNFTTMGDDVVGAIRNRLVMTSNKPISSVTAALSGSNVLIVPDGFIKLKNGVNIPYFRD